MKQASEARGWRDKLTRFLHSAWSSWRHSRNTLSLISLLNWPTLFTWLLSFCSNDVRKILIVLKNPRHRSPAPFYLDILTSLLTRDYEIRSCALALLQIFVHMASFPACLHSGKASLSSEWANKQLKDWNYAKYFWIYLQRKIRYSSSSAFFLKIVLWSCPFRAELTTSNLEHPQSSRDRVFRIFISKNDIIDFRSTC